MKKERLIIFYHKIMKISNISEKFEVINYIGLPL